MNNQIMREQFNASIREYKESINKRDHDLHLLEKEELCELIVRLRERLFNDTLSTSDIDDSNCEQRNQNNDQILRDLFEQSRNQTELLEKMTEIFSKPINFKTIIKLSLAFIFIWTVKTHIIDAYTKRK
jgi:Fe2+ transport system protein B